MSKSSHAKEILRKIVLVNVEMGIWSGYKRTSDSDLKKMGTKIPPGGIITKGGKQIFPRDPLKGFQTLKKEISRKLTSMGVAVLGGSARAIPVESMKDVEKYLEAAEAKYGKLLASFEAGYDGALSSHLSNIVDPVVSEVVFNSVISRSEAVSRFRFMWDIFKVDPQRGKGDGLISNLSNKLFVEIGVAANDIYNKSFVGKQRVGVRALNQIVALRNKMAGLSMLDGENIKPVVDHMDSVLNRMPKDGWIESMEYSALVGLVSMLSDPDKMLAHAASINAGMSVTTQPAAQVVQATDEPQLSPAEASAETDAETKVEEQSETQVEAEVEVLAKAVVVTEESKPEVKVAPKLTVVSSHPDLWAEEAPLVKVKSDAVEAKVESEARPDVTETEKEESKPEDILPVMPTSRIGKVASAYCF